MPRANLDAVRIALAVLLLSSACRFEPTPGAAPIRCSTSTDCPNGLTCRATVQLCVAADAERQPPTLSDISLTPTIGRAGTRFTATFRVDEALLGPPRVDVVFRSGRSRPFTLVTAGNPSTPWAYGFTADGTEPADEGRLRVTATDGLGNEGSLDTDATLTLDFEAPFPGRATLTYTSPAPLIAPSVEKLAIGGQARIVATFDEPLAGAPRLTLSPDVATAELEPGADQREAAWRISLRPGADGSGALDVVAHVRDALGNEADRRLPLVTPLAFDADPPRFETVPSLERAPFGDALRPTPHFVVVGRATPDSVLRALNDVASTFELARGQVAADGGFSLSVPSVEQVAVQLVDEAGNTSPITPVASVSTLLSFRTSTATNPLRALSLGAWGPSLNRLDAVDLDGDALARSDGRVSESLGAASWAWLGANHNSSRQAGLAYFPPIGRVVGLGEEGFNVLDRVRWLPRSVPGVQLPALVFPSVAYDANRGVLVLFGGSQSTDLYELHEAGWRRLNPTNHSATPPARTLAALTAGPLGVHVFGGRTPADAPLRDVWRWSAGAWQALDAGAMPRACMAATYDAKRDRVVVVASNDAGPAELWQSLDGTQFARVQTGVGACGPLSWDTELDRAVGVGLLRDGGTEVWSWQASDGGVASRPVRLERWLQPAQCAWHPVEGTLLCQGTYGVTYRLTDAGFVEAAQPYSWHPTGSREGALAELPDGGRLFRCGAAYGVAIGQTFSWADDVWTPLDFLGAPTNAEVRFGHTFSWAPDLGTLVMVGGVAHLQSSMQFVPRRGPDGGVLIASETLRLRLLDDGGTNWSTAVPLDAGLARYGHAAFVYDGGLVVVGGADEAVAWRLGAFAQGWRSEPTVGQHPGWFQAATTMLPNGAVFAAGGRAGARAAPLASLSLLTHPAAGFTWTPLSTQLPNAVSGATATYDGDRDTVLLFGGTYATEADTNDAWFVGVDGGLERVVPSDPEGDGEPEARSQATAFFEPVTHRHLVIGGSTSFDTWALERWKHRASVQLRVPLPSVGISTQAPLKVVLSVTGTGLGKSADGQSDVAGLDVEVWRQDHFVSLGTKTSSPFEVVVDAVTLRELGPAGLLAFQLSSHGINAAGTARVTLDAAEVRVRVVE